MKPNARPELFASKRMIFSECKLDMLKSASGMLAEKQFQQ
jgi:hypothetical protein